MVREEGRNSCTLCLLQASMRVSFIYLSVYSRCDEYAFVLVVMTIQY
jgi:hypothetical protein